MKPRSERRRDEREGNEPSPSRRPVSIWAGGLVGAGLAVVAVGAVLLFTGGDGDDTTQDTALPLVEAVTPDQIALEAIARRTIESLPSRRWTSLYVEFTDEYQERCSIEEFTAAGNDAIFEQGATLAEIRYVGIQSFAIQPTHARLIIAAELVDSQYSTGADFDKVDDVWRIAPVAGSVGCEAFDRLG
jgi:hypothetical protein